MKTRIKIYLGIIAFLVCFLIYAIFFMKSDFIETKTLPPTVEIKKVNIGDPNIKVYKPDFMPKPIPKQVVVGAMENDFYYYLFINKNRKTLLYQFKPGSKDAADSEAFHKGIENYLGKVLIDGHYKNYYVTDIGSKTYHRLVLEHNDVANYVPSENDSKKHIQEMADKKRRIEAVIKFYEECAKTFCIINSKAEEYVVIDKRDLEVAKKLLADYKNW